MLSKKAFENWNFEYCEAEREFLEAKRTFEIKLRDICLFLFNAYACWCKQRYGAVLKPEPTVIDSQVDKPAEAFFCEYEVGPQFRRELIRLLNQAYDERIEGFSKHR